MKFKLDENLGLRTQNLFREAGHDVRTVHDQKLQGISDARLFRLCREEQRCLVTLDLDFSDITRFPPEKSGGIVVLRIPRNPSLALLQRMVSQFLHACIPRPITGKLWVVEIDRIREHQLQESADGPE